MCPGERAAYANGWADANADLGSAIAQLTEMCIDWMGVIETANDLKGLGEQIDRLRVLLGDLSSQITKATCPVDAYATPKKLDISGLLAMRRPPANLDRRD